MKKFLLSIFAVMLAVFSVQAETKTYTYDFSKNTNWVTTKGGSTAVATGSSNKLNAFYDKATGDAFNAGSKGYFNNSGYFLWGASGAYIELPTYAGEKITNVTATSSSQGSTSVQVGVYNGSNVVCAAVTWSSKNTDYSYDIPEEYQSSVLRLQIASKHNAQITKLVITTEETTDAPVYQLSLPTINVENESRINIGTSIVINPAAGNTVAYSVDGGSVVEGVTETVQIIAEEAGVMTLSIASTCNDETLTAEYTYYVKPAMPTMTDAVGFEESLDVEFEGEGEIYFTLNGDDPTTESDIYEGTITITETTTIKAIAVVEDVVSDVATATYTKLNKAVPGYTSDVLTCEIIGVSGTSYKEWEGITLNSTAVYAGQSAGGNESVQLRSKESSSGIVTTISGGRAVKVVVAWNENTTSGRTLDIYGKDTEYASAADLYSSSTQGTKIGSIVYGTSTELVIDGDYEYIGLRSNSGAMYLDEIEITWANPYMLNVTDAGYATMFLGFDATIPTIDGEDNGVFTATESIVTGYVHLNPIEGVLPAETGVIIKAAEGTYEFWPSTGATADVTGNLLKGTLSNDYIDVEAYVLGKVDGEVGLYKALMTDGVWLNNANKAYLPASAVPNNSATFYGFDWEGTTGIDEVKGENVNVTVIYDLTGRRVEAITAPGIYVVNGKKVLVK